MTMTTGLRETLARITTDLELAPYGGDVHKKMQADNLKTWLELQALEHGTPDQRARYVQGALPEEEILQIARAILFKPFGAFERWTTGRERDRMIKALRHGYGCPHTDDSYEWEMLAFEVADAPTVERANLAAIQAMADGAEIHPWLNQTGGKLRVEAHTYWVTCKGCEAESARSNAKVIITWGERELVREYAL
jgi:hypothetical protein